MENLHWRSPIQVAEGMVGLLLQALEWPPSATPWSHITSHCGHCQASLLRRYLLICTSVLHHKSVSVQFSPNEPKDVPLSWSAPTPPPSRRPERKFVKLWQCFQQLQRRNISRNHVKNLLRSKTSPQAKRHELSLQVTFKTIFTFFTIFTS